MRSAVRRRPVRPAPRSQDRPARGRPVRPRPSVRSPSPAQRPSTTPRAASPGVGEPSMSRPRVSAPLVVELEPDASTRLTEAAAVRRGTRWLLGSRTVRESERVTRAPQPNPFKTFSESPTLHRNGAALLSLRPEGGRAEGDVGAASSAGPGRRVSRRAGPSPGGCPRPRVGDRATRATHQHEDGLLSLQQ